MKKHLKEPLYRKVNTLAPGVHHRWGGEYRWSRSAEKAGTDQPLHESMHCRHQRGLDYTPLFRFLLSRIGEEWSVVHSEASARLDRSEPIFWMVARNDGDRKPIVWIGENSSWSGLYVDDDGRLAVVDPGLRIEDMGPSCPCCTHTFNGVRYVRPYRPR
jgi:hypothetical protein